jgi:PhoH-like ATPase
MRKSFVLDTSVLAYDPNAFKSFHGNDVIIPIDVLYELDKLKTFPNEAGKNSRLCIRALDALCKHGAIHKGIKIENDIRLKIDTFAAPDTFGPATYIDNKILACAFNIKEKNIKKKGQPPTILVSKDINLRVRARAFDILAEDYEKDRVTVRDLYDGFRTIVDIGLAAELRNRAELFLDSHEEFKAMHPNECVYLKGEKGSSAIGRKIDDKIKLVRSTRPWGLETRNMEQAMAVDLLCDPKIPLVTMIGRAGSGKTLIGIASALEMVMERKMYQKMVVYRPIQTVGKDLGYLPGTLDEKIAPHMQAIHDSFEFLLSSKGGGDRWKVMFDMWREKEIIQLDAIAYVRGRSIPNTLMIIDESQNLSKEEMKTILTRAGQNTKIIITGDIEQIDNTNLDASNNGLTYVVEKFKDSALSGHITLSKGERSELATLASSIL